MAEKSLWFRMFGEDRVTPVFKKVGDEAELTAAKVRASFAEAGAMVGGPIGKGTAEASRGMTLFGKSSMLAAGVTIGAVGAIAYHTTKMAGDFQAAVTRLATTAGESKKNLDLVSQGILNMAGKVGYTAQELATGLYTVESAGFHGAAGLKVMQAAAKGARTEGADLTTVTDAVTSAMVDFHMRGAKGAAEATNTLIAAVGRGKTTMEGMAAAFPNVAAAASAVGISMQETASAIATMTQHGTDAAKAGTYLRQILGQLASGGSAQAQKVMAGLGLSAAHVSKELGTKGLAATITTLQTALKKHLTPAGMEALNMFKQSKAPISSYHTLLHKMGGGAVTTFGALAKMVGGVRSLQAILQLGGKNLKTFKDVTAQVSATVHKAGGRIAGFGEYTGTFNAKVSQAKGNLSALGVGIGTDLLPAMTSFVGALSSGVSWLGKHKTATEIVLAGITGLATGFLTVKVAMLSWSAATKIATAAQRLFGIATAETDAALLANPIGLVVAALFGLGAALVVAYKKSETFRNIVNGVFSWLKGAVVATIGFVKSHWQLVVGVIAGPLVLAVVEVIKHWDAIKNAISHAVSVTLGWIKGHWQLLVGIITGPFGIIVAEVATHWSQIVGFFRSAWDRIRSAVTSGIGNVVGLVRSLPGRVLSALGNLGHLLWDAGTSIISGLAEGIWSATVGKLGSVLSSVTGFIKDHKGPIEVDRVLLRPAGEAIMDGLIDGINAKTGELKKMLTAVTGMVTNAGQKLQSDMQARAQFQSSFVSTYASSAFGATDAQGNPVSNVAGMLSYQRQQLASALQLKQDTRKLIGEGLSKALLQQLAGAGSSGLAQIHALASGPETAVRRLNRLDRQTTIALGQAAHAAGGDIYGATIAADKQRKALAKDFAEELHKALTDLHKKSDKAASDQERTIRDLSQRLAKLGDQVRTGAHDGVAGLKDELDGIRSAIDSLPRQTQTLKRSHGSTHRKGK